MQLTPAQKTMLKNHILANTNAIQAFVAGQGDATQSLPIKDIAGDVGDNWQRIANWYNRTAQGGDAQPITNLRVWNPGVTMRQHNTAIDYTLPAFGSTAQDRVESLTLYQILIWAGQANLDGPAFDMTDPQVRAGVIRVWGDTNSSNAFRLGGTGGGLGCGQKIGSTFELILSGAPGGSSAGGAFTNARTVQKDADGALLYGQAVSGAAVADARANG